ncbi:MAG: hypothetical protein IT307_18485, partial [Chloroflexi bacterium]|nr:hypothetical protein [Chloroflexota bacterium]
MSRALTVTVDTVDTADVRPSQAIKAAAKFAPMLVVTSRAFNYLVAELGRTRKALRHLFRCAEKAGRPVGVNLPSPTGSQTYFMAPRGWTPERLRGWVGAKHQELEAQFGP